MSIYVTKGIFETKDSLLGYNCISFIRWYLLQVRCHETVVIITYHPGVCDKRYGYKNHILGILCEIYLRIQTKHLYLIFIFIDAVSKKFLNSDSEQTQNRPYNYEWKNVVTRSSITFVFINTFCSKNKLRYSHSSYIHIPTPTRSCMYINQIKMLIAFSFIRYTNTILWFLLLSDMRQDKNFLKRGE